MTMQRFLLLLACALPAAALDAPAAAQQRVLAPDDLFRVDQVRSIAWSPDGRFAAIGITDGTRVLKRSVPDGDLWILDSQARRLDRLDVQHDGKRGVWNAVWSPDGGTLAFLVLDDRAVVTAWTWRPGAAAVRMDGLEVRVDTSDPPIVWTDSRTLLVIAWLDGAPRGGGFYNDVLPGTRATELWRLARDGREASVSVLESGGAGTAEATAQVIAVDAASGARRTLVRGRPHRMSVSHDGRSLAWFEENPPLSAQRVASFFEHDELYEAVAWGSELNVVDVATGRAVADPVDVVSAGYESMVWSSAGTLALPGRLRGSSGANGLLALSGGAIAPVQMAGLVAVQPATARWLGGALLIRGRTTPQDRWDWWLLDQGARRNLTSQLEAAPASLVTLPDGTALGAAGGAVWRVSAERDPVRMAAAGAISALAALSPARGLLTANVDGARAVVRIAGDTLRHVPLVPPQAGAALRATSPAGDAAIWSASTDSGTFLWLTGGAGRPLDDAYLIWQGNTWVAEIARGEEVWFRYTSGTGAEVGGWLLLPPDYRRGARVPLVVEVYPGRQQRESASPFSLLDPLFLNPHLFAARGYAVLMPTMPDVETLPPADRLGSLTLGVLPAIDTLIARGIVDADRIGIVGQSYGGYATLGLIAHTDRFRAAIALASLSNLTSLYGTFYGQRRYGEGGDPQAGQVLRMLQLERGYAGMGVAPWEAPADYIAASPLFHADRVTTPLMLVHGDQDFVPIQQSEEYFTALYRRDRRVQFVRYHGEEHVITTRGNVIDLWQRTGAWLDELLACRTACRR